MRVIRLLAPHKLAVLIVVVLLVCQAFCELSLPRYTSDIVDVGIQQEGIEHVAADELSAATFGIAELLIDDEDRSLLEDSYDVTDAGTYVLNEDGRANIEALDELLAVPLVLAHADASSFLAGADVDDDAAALFGDAAADAGADLGIEALVAAWQAGALSEEQRAAFADVVTANLAGADSSLLDQQAIVAVRAEYEQLGYDLSAIQTSYLLRTGGLMLLVAAGCMACAVVVGLVASRTGAKIGFNLRNGLFRQVMRFSEGDVGYFSAASLITRGTNDIQLIQNTVVMLMRMVLYSPILAIGGIIMVASMNAPLGWIIVVAILLVVVAVAILFKIAMPKFVIMQKLVDRVNLVAREILTGLPVIRSFDREAFEAERFDAASSDLTRTQLFTNRVMAFMMPTMMLVMNAVSVAIVWFGGFSVNNGAIQTGDLIAFISYAMVIIMSFMMIGMIAMMLPRASVAAGRVTEVLAHEPLICDPEPGEAATLAGASKAHGAEIRFEDVSFRYDDEGGNILDHVSFTAEPGTTLAIVGATGSGKSTVMKLIERFYDVTEGSVRIDGVDVRDLPQSELRAQIGYVPQKAFLFSGTVSSNMAYGAYVGQGAPGAGDTPPSIACITADEQRAREVLGIAQAASFVEARGGLGAPISQGGANVSGGQRQRLAIARALMSGARALLFDDSFSALDYKTDAALRRALSESMGETTCIIVAQRIATVMGAERIVVLSEGRVVGQGTHDELMKSCEEYRQIALSQLSEAELTRGGDAA